MDEIDSLIGPGTAGLTQRISTESSEGEQDKGYASVTEISETELYVVKPNKLLSCGQNQY